MGRFLLNLIEFLMITLVIIIYTVLFSPLYFILGVDVAWYYLLFTLLLLVVSMVVSNVKIWSKYRGVSEVDSESEIQSKLRSICDEGEIQKPRLVVIDSPVPNAYAIDYIGFRPIIILTDSLVYSLDGDEVKSVMSHEVSHLVSYDSYLMTSLSSIIRFIRYLHNMTRRVSIYEEIIFTIILIIPFIVTRVNLFVARCIFFAMSRTREFKADKDSAELTKASSMKSALVKISKQIEDLEEQQRREYKGDENLSIMPVSLKDKLFSTHPKTEERIQRLNQLED